MKSNPFLAALLAASVLSPPLRADEAQAAGAAPVGVARLIGSIPDGTPLPPAPAKQEFIIPAADILESEAHPQGGRIITVQRVNPLPLPLEPEEVASAADIDPAAFSQRLAEYRASFPKVEVLGLGATVYRSLNSPPRTLITWWPVDQSGPVSFWSSADFALVAGGIREFVGTDGITRRLFLMWGQVDQDQMRERFAARGCSYMQKEIPAFPDGPATFVSAGGQAPASLSVALQSLHAIYQDELPRLAAAHESRENYRRLEEAARKANPPRPQNITLSYWHSEAPAPEEGGAR